MTKALKLHYAWWILLGAAMGIGFSIGLVYYAFSIMVGPLEEEFGWSRSQIMNAPMIWVFVAAFCMIPAGKVNDRRGPRLVMAMGSAFCAAALVGMAFMQAAWQYYLLNAALAFGMVGISQPICTGTVARWFEKLRGMAMGSTIAGGAVGAFIASRLWPPILRSYGTQGVYLASAAVCAFLLFPYLLLVMRRAPEDHGLKAYGAADEASAAGEAGAAAAPQEPEGLSSPEARRTANFWLILLFTLFANFAYNAVAMHFVPIYEAAGMTRDSASHALGYTILLSFIGKVGGGWIADRVSIRKFLALTQATFCAACFSLLFAGTAWQLPVFVVLWGISLGFSAGAYTALMPECFGIKELSTIMSTFMILQVFGAGFGPKISAWIFDIAESYTVAFAIAGACYFVTMLLALCTRPRFLSADKRKQAKTAET